MCRSMQGDTLRPPPRPGDYRQIILGRAQPSRAGRRVTLRIGYLSTIPVLACPQDLVMSPIHLLSLASNEPFVGVSFLLTPHIYLPLQDSLRMLASASFDESRPLVWCACVLGGYRR